MRKELEELMRGIEALLGKEEEVVEKPARISVTTVDENNEPVYPIKGKELVYNKLTGLSIEFNGRPNDITTLFELSLTEFIKEYVSEENYNEFIDIFVNNIKGGLK